MHHLRRNTEILFSVLVIGAMALAACGPAATAVPTSAPTQPAATQPSSSPATSAPTAAPTATSAPQVTIKNPNTIVEGTIGYPESLDPAWAYDTASGEVIFNVYQTLLFQKKDSTTDFVPMLATKWDVSSDGLTYTFTIRKGVKFQDGEDLTPQDVAYSFWRGLIQDRSGGPQWILLQPFFGLDVTSFQNDVVKAKYGGNFANACQAVEKAITYDNSAGTVTMKLAQPYGPMLQLLTGTWASVVSMPWVGKQGGWDGNCSDASKYHDPAAQDDPLFKVMNGTGPYSLSSLSPGTEVDLTSNPSYWQTDPLWTGGPSGAPAVKNVAIKNISEWGTRFASFKTGDLDINYVPTQYESQVAPLVGQTCDASGKCQTTNASGTITLYKGLPTVEETALYPNENVNVTGGNNLMGTGKLDGNGIPANFFSDIHVRTAFEYCFDWATYISQVENGEAIQAFGPVIKGELGYDPNQAHYSLDLSKCTSEFKASTLTAADGTSLWDEGFYFQATYNEGNDQRKSALDILSQNLLKVNPKFHMEVVAEPFALELSDQVAGRLPLFALGWLEDYHDPQDWVVPFMSSGGTYSEYQHFPSDVQTQLDNLIKQGVSTSDTTQRASVYQQIQNLSYQNALDIFLVQPLGNHYQQSWIKGYYYNPIYPGMYFYSLSKGS